MYKERIPRRTLELKLKEKRPARWFSQIQEGITKRGKPMTFHLSTCIKTEMKPDEGENGSNENTQKSEYEYEEDPEDRKQNRSKRA
jgi:hypothetical protein